MASEELETYIVPSRSSDRSYAVTIFEDETANCTCESYKFRRSCSHIRGVAEHRAARVACASLNARVRSIAARLMALDVTSDTLAGAEALWDTVDELDVLAARLKARTR